MLIFFSVISSLAHITSVYFLPYPSTPNSSRVASRYGFTGTYSATSICFFFSFFFVFLSSTILWSVVLLSLIDGQKSTHYFSLLLSSFYLSFSLFFFFFDDFSSWLDTLSRWTIETIINNAIQRKHAGLTGQVVTCLLPFGPLAQAQQDAFLCILILIPFCLGLGVCDSGDTDGRVPVIGSRYCIEALGLSLKSPWRSWYHHSQVHIYYLLSFFLYSINYIYLFYLSKVCWVG